MKSLSTGTLFAVAFSAMLAGCGKATTPDPTIVANPGGSVAKAKTKVGNGTKNGGGGIGSLVERMQPKAPVMYHFGAEDSYIPESTIEQIREADPSGIFHIYEGAGHGFNCDDRDSYDAESAKLSEQRSLEFLAEKL
jgi:carboxymethylenebutenolidase